MRPLLIAAIVLMTACTTTRVTTTNEVSETLPEARKGVRVIVTYTDENGRPSTVNGTVLNVTEDELKLRDDRTGTDLIVSANQMLNLTVVESDFSVMKTAALILTVPALSIVLLLVLVSGLPTF